MSLWPVIWAHWLFVALILLAIVAVTGIFDLLWLAIAALVVAGLSALFPGGIGFQAGVFFVCSIALIAFGRYVGSRFDGRSGSHPDLNHRARQMIGKRGAAIADFANGVGEIKISDSQWRAKCETDISAGTQLEVIDSDGVLLIVRPWRQ